MTPRLTPHARARCAEMGIGTKDAKRVAADPDVRYGHHPESGHTEGTVCLSARYPTIAVVAVDRGGVPVVLTVLWRTGEQYDRATYRPTRESA